MIYCKHCGHYYEKYTTIKHKAIIEIISKYPYINQADILNLMSMHNLSSRMTAQKTIKELVQGNIIDEIRTNNNYMCKYIMKPKQTVISRDSE